MNQNLVSFSLGALLLAGGLALADKFALADDMPSTQPATAPSAIDLHNTVCPVSGDAVGDSTFTATYQGKIYHFCCDGCPAKFSANPDKYAGLIAADPAKYGVKSN